MTLAVSPDGRAYIEQKEGLRLEAYQDIVGIWTIGYGHTGPDIVEGLTITKEEADQMFADRLSNEFEPAVGWLVENVPTTQYQFDAMVSLAYNIGTGETEKMRIENIHGHTGFAGSSVLRFHLKGEYEEAAQAFLLWNKAGGRFVQALYQRRQEEMRMYLGGKV